MIKLDQAHLAKLEVEYKDRMRSVIQNRLNSLMQPIPPNPFTGFAFTDIFLNNNGTVNLNLIEALLAKPLEVLTVEYPQVGYYIQTSKLVYYSGWQINNELEKIGKSPTNGSRIDFRMRYVECYSQGNPWLNTLLNRHPNFAQNMHLFHELIKEARQQLDHLNELLSEIVDYKMIDPDYRHSLLTRMGTEVCPYCNRQYITKFTLDDNTPRSMADLDHYYPKSVFQLLSLSLYNFVPSCQHCNSRFKLAKSLEIMYPYEQGFEDDAYFHVKINGNTTLDSLTGQNTDFELELIVAKTGLESIPIRNSVNMFHINDVYQSHKEYVRELLYKKQAYSSSYKDELLNLFSLMKLTEADIHLFLYGNRLLPEEQYKKPLSKLTYDIIAREKG
ncbi:hypothetical protein [Paenibacillus amylolyticus]|uniref:HNH endonuclease n=1 Tax=Paenibacillus amylolyticus TaxID=1451 RepID=A0ABD8B2Z4_PAEAM